ncbi:MAG: hypothetical protein DWI02_01690, partial [Planctomycetota bacterium]
MKTLPGQTTWNRFTHHPFHRFAETRDGTSSELDIRILPKQIANVEIDLVRFLKFRKGASFVRDFDSMKITRYLTPNHFDSASPLAFMSAVMSVAMT